MINTVDKMDIIDSFLKFMWNYWSPEENERFCKFMRKEWLVEHMWNKWVECIEACGSIGAPAMFWSLLCNNTQAELVNFITCRKQNG